MTFLLLALACQSAPLSLSEAESEALEVEPRVDEDSETVLTVTWTTETTSDAVLEYGTGDRYGAVVEGWSSDDGLEHAVVLAGLSADLEWHWRAVAQSPTVGLTFRRCWTPSATGGARTPTSSRGRCPNTPKPSPTSRCARSYSASSTAAAAYTASLLRAAARWIC